MHTVLFYLHSVSRALVQVSSSVLWYTQDVKALLCKIDHNEHEDLLQFFFFFLLLALVKPDCLISFLLKGSHDDIHIIVAKSKHVTMWIDEWSWGQSEMKINKKRIMHTIWICWEKRQFKLLTVTHNIITSFCLKVKAT